MKKRLGIIGARGFAGGELLRIAVRHPNLEVTYVTSESQAGARVDSSFPTLLGATDLTFSSFDADQASDLADAFVMALPDGEAMRNAPVLLERGKPVVDLSGDFRVRDRATYERWYKREHLAPELLEEAVYGMPEFHPEIREARLVANPGCYPTAILLAVAPLAAAGLARLDTLVVDAKSGVSGAGGRAAMGEAFSFTAVNENLRAYSTVGHRHIAEMEQELGLLSRAEPPPMTFSPHLLPITRGILATCYVTLTDNVDRAALLKAYQDFYARAAFVRVLAEGLPEIRHVVGSNMCLVGLAYDERTRRAICVSVIDNLVKGAAGSAIQNLNLVLGLDERAGLEAPAIGP